MDASAVGAPQGGLSTPSGEDRTTRVLVAVPIVVVIVMGALYVAIAVNQNSLDHAPPERFIFPFIAAYLAVMAVLLTVSLMPRRTVATRTALRQCARRPRRGPP